MIDQHKDISNSEIPILTNPLKTAASFESMLMARFESKAISANDAKDEAERQHHAQHGTGTNKS